MRYASHETTSLLNGNLRPPGHSYIQRAAVLVKSEGKHVWAAPYRWLILSSHLNILLLFVPLSILSQHLNWDAALCFLFSSIAIIPLAKLLGDVTKQLSFELGRTSVSLTKAACGNAVEIIVGVTALLQDEVRIVQTLMLGSILRNILLIPGCSFIAAGFKSKESSFHATGAQASASLLTLACITLVIPAAFRISYGIEATVITSIGDEMSNLEPSAQAGLLIISRGTAILLLCVYAWYLFFQLKTHSFLFESHDESEGEEPKMGMMASGIALFVTAAVTWFCANYLVASIDETAKRYLIPKPFIGLILLPIVANATEHFTAMSMALKYKMEIAVSVCVGRSIQIAAFVIPLLIIVGWISGYPFILYLSNVETAVFFASVLLVNTLIRDGRSNYLDGIMLVTLYLIIALSFWVS